MLKEDDDTKKASFFFTAYTKDGVDDPATRPIVFAFNGGPGSSSVWLHLGLLGPRRVELDDKGNGITKPGRLVVNEHTLLTHADLVFIDPISTGFTRAIDKDEERSYHHFEKDIETVATSSAVTSPATNDGRRRSFSQGPTTWSPSSKAPESTTLHSILWRNASPATRACQRRSCGAPTFGSRSSIS